MKLSRSVVLICVLVTTGRGLDPMTARAEPVQFTIDRTQSALTISGTFSGFAVQPQGVGSLVTSYTGTIEAEVTSSTIAFVGGSVIAAVTNGSWEPATGGGAGTGPANYGGEVVNVFVDGKAAIRDVVVDVASEALPVSSGTFPSQGLRFNFVQTAASVIDYNYSTLTGSSGSGSQVLSGTLTNSISTNATVVTQGSELVLTIPVDLPGSASVSSPDDLQYRFRGTLVGRAAAPVLLQINSLQVTPGTLKFTLATTPGHSYTILGSTNLMDWPTVIDQFTATDSPTVRNVAQPTTLTQQYFRVRRD